MKVQNINDIKAYAKGVKSLIWLWIRRDLFHRKNAA